MWSPRIEVGGPAYDLREGRWCVAGEDGGLAAFLEWRWRPGDRSRGVCESAWELGGLVAEWEVRKVRAGLWTESPCPHLAEIGTLVTRAEGQGTPGLNVTLWREFCTLGDVRVSVDLFV